MQVVRHDGGPASVRDAQMTERRFSSPIRSLLVFAATTLTDLETRAEPPTASFPALHADLHSATIMDKDNRDDFTFAKLSDLKMPVTFRM